MTAKEARHQIDVANYMKRLAEELEQDARYGVEMPRPGCFVKDIRTGQMFVVLSNGQIDGFRDSGRTTPDSWLWFDVVQDGEPPMPGAPPGVT